MRKFHILVVSAVKICKHCLQTALANGVLRPLTVLRPWTLLGQPTGLQPTPHAMKIRGVTTD